MVNSCGVAMLVVQLITTGTMLLSRAVLGGGAFIFALVAYRCFIAAVGVAPLALYFDSREGRSKLSWKIGFWLSLNALTGMPMATGFFFYGLKDTTTTYANYFRTLIPVVTFIFSLLIRVEKLRLGTRGGKMKVFGAMLCPAGVVVMCLLKGPSFHLGHFTLTHAVSAKKNWLRGTIFLACSVVSFTAWYIVQAKLSKVFPYKYFVTTLTCLLASVQATAIGMCFDKSMTAWRQEWNLQLLVLFYLGIFATAALFCLTSWVVSKKGPTYPSVFNPFSLICVTIAEAALYNELITVGSLVGMCLNIVGIYLFLSGKRRERKGPILPEAAQEVDDEAAETPTTVMPEASLSIKQ